MSADERGLTRRDRYAAINRLDELAVEIASASSWLGKYEDDGFEIRRAALLIESAWTNLQAAAHQLTPPVRLNPEGWLDVPGR